MSHDIHKMNDAQLANLVGDVNSKLFGTAPRSQPKDRTSDYSATLAGVTAMNETNRDRLFKAISGRVKAQLDASDQNDLGGLPSGVGALADELGKYFAARKASVTVQTP